MPHEERPIPGSRPCPTCARPCIPARNHTSRFTYWWCPAERHVFKQPIPGLENLKIDAAANQFRIRVLPPGRFRKGSFRTHHIEPGVTRIVGIPKASHDVPGPDLDGSGRRLQSFRFDRDRFTRAAARQRFAHLLLQDPQ